MTNWSIDFSPMLPEPLFWAAGAASLVLIGLFFVRRTRGAAFRALAMLTMLLALANPTLREEERESLGNIALVLIDESTSQMLAGRPEQARAIRADLEAKLGRIPNLQVKWVTAARPDAGTSGTNIFAELNRALANTPPDRLAGVVLITDGQIHDVPKSAAALGFDAPVHVLLTGRPGEFDRRLEVVKAPRYAIVGQTRDVEVAVRETGRTARPGEMVTLRIRREGQADETRRAAIGRTVTIPMAFPHAGENILEIELERADGELTQANNRAVVVAEGVRENLRVLLVSGEPHAGERTWRNLLKSDAAVDLVHFTILRPPEKQQNDYARINELSLIQFPTRELFSEKIRDFDLIIFDRYKHRQTTSIINLLYFDNIARYVENHGGALLVAAGDDYAGTASLFRTPLSPVLPAPPTGRVIEMAFKAKMTPDGLRHPVTRGLPGGSDTAPTWGTWYRQVEVSPDRGRIVMKGAEDRPLLVLDRKGAGRVAFLTSDHAWLWARGHDGGGPHSDLLRRLSHWLMKEPDLEEERLIASARGMKLSIERRTMETKVPPVAMSAPGGGTSQVELEASGTGLWRATVDVQEPGLYKLSQPSPTGQLTAVAHAGIDDPREMSEVTATEQKVAALVDATGGGTFWTRSGGLLASADPTSVTVPRVSVLTGGRVLAGSDWMGLKDRDAYLTRGVKLTPMFTGLAALSVLLLVVALAWWREGR
ncbi:MAG: hypothetical protein ACOYLQ_00500 [Hyphomicrobiaceae bacterium]